jgi:hypothetical protein
MTTSAASDFAPGPDALAAPVAPSRLALVAGVWGLIGVAHAWGTSPAVASAVVALATGLGLAILLLSKEEPRWSSLLAAVMLATSPLLQKLWLLPSEGPAGDRVMLLRTMVIVCGLLMLARLGAGHADQDGAPPEPESA